MKPKPPSLESLLARIIALESLTAMLAAMLRLLTSTRKVNRWSRTLTAEEADEFRRTLHRHGVDDESRNEVRRPVA